MKRSIEPTLLMDGLEEEALVRMARDGDKDAWGEIVTRWAPYIKRSIRRAINNAEDANDAFQETAISLMSTIQRMKHDNFAGWMRVAIQMRIRSFLARSVMKANRMRYGVEFDFEVIRTESRECDPLLSCSLNEIIHTVRLAVKGLPKKQREAIEGVEFQGKTQAELAKELRVSRMAITDRIRNAKKALRASLSEHENKKE